MPRTRSRARTSQARSQVRTPYTHSLVLGVNAEEVHGLCSFVEQDLLHDVGLVANTMSRNTRGVSEQLESESSFRDKAPLTPVLGTFMTKEGRTTTIVGFHIVPMFESAVSDAFV